MDEILALEDANAQQARLANVMHDIAAAYLKKIITTAHWMGPNSKLVILSGLMINVDGDQPDVFEPLKFTMQS